MCQPEGYWLEKQRVLLFNVSITKAMFVNKYLRYRRLLRNKSSRYTSDLQHRTRETPKKRAPKTPSKTMIRSPFPGACNSHNSQGNSIFTDQSIFKYFSSKIRQFQSAPVSVTIKQCGLTWTCRHVNISSCLWLVTEVPVGIWIRDKFKLKIDRSMKTPCQEYGVVAGS